MVYHTSASGRDLAMDIQVLLLNIGIAYSDETFEGVHI